jgi:hypothetical protein
MKQGRMEVAAELNIDEVNLAANWAFRRVLRAHLSFVQYLWVLKKRHASGVAERALRGWGWLLCVVVPLFSSTFLGFADASLVESKRMSM